MAPELAAILCLVFVAYLFKAELSGPTRQTISWAPFLWMFIAGTRFVSTWLNLRAPGASVDAYAEGSPVDRTVFFALIVYGSIVLARRNISWSSFFAQNKLLIVYFGYCLASILWTDEPFILSKRWVKDLGNPIMATVLLTESRPYDAVVTTLRRLSFICLPVSVLFIKYYPELGRGFTATGAVMYTGVGDQKNALGLICLVSGTAYAWWLLHRTPSWRTVDKYYWLMLPQIGWLMFMSNSQTSLVCLFATLAILVASKMRLLSKHPRRLFTLTVTTALILGVLEASLGIRAQVAELLGRDSTFTNRTEIWRVLTSLEANPIFGTGFMSFWSGARMRAVWDAFDVTLNQAHNGYIEQYLNLGYIGVGLIVIIAMSALLGIQQGLSADYSGNVLRLCLLTSALLYNFTEASFSGINNIWVLFLVSAINPTGKFLAVPDRPLRSVSATQHQGASGIAAAVSAPRRLQPLGSRVRSLSRHASRDAKHLPRA